MTELAKVSLVIGASTILCWLPALLLPEGNREWCRRFPRNTIAGWALAAVDVAWSAWLLNSAPFVVEIAWAKTAVLVGAPILFLAIVFFLDELLAARALGGILLLVPRPMIDAAFIHSSQSRLFITVLAYLMVIVGIVLVLSPYWFRKTAEVVLRTNARSRMVGAAGVIVGVAIVVLAIAAY